MAGLKHLVVAGVFLVSSKLAIAESNSPRDEGEIVSRDYTLRSPHGVGHQAHPKHDDRSEADLTRETVERVDHRRSRELDEGWRKSKKRVYARPGHTGGPLIEEKRDYKFRRHPEPGTEVLEDFLRIPGVIRVDENPTKPKPDKLQPINEIRLDAEPENLETEPHVNLRPEHHSPFIMERGQGSGTSGKEAEQLWDPAMRDALLSLRRRGNAESGESNRDRPTERGPFIQSEPSIWPEDRSPLKSESSHNKQGDGRRQPGSESLELGASNIRERGQNIQSGLLQPKHQITGGAKPGTPGIATKPPVVLQPRQPSGFEHSNKQQGYGSWGRHQGKIHEPKSQIVRKRDQNIDSGEVEPKRQVTANMGPKTPGIDKLTNESRQGHDNQSEFGKSNYQHWHGQEQTGYETPNVGSLNIPKHNIELGAVQPKGQIPVGLEPKAPKVDKLSVQLRPEHHSPFNQGQSHKLGDSHGRGSGEIRSEKPKVSDDSSRERDRSDKSVEQQPKHQIAIGTGPKITEPLGGPMIPLGPLQIKHDNNQHGHGQGHSSEEMWPEKPAISSNSSRERDRSAESNWPHRKLQFPAPSVQLMPGHHIPPEAVHPHHQIGHGEGLGSGESLLEHLAKSKETSAEGWDTSAESYEQQPIDRVGAWTESIPEGLGNIEDDYPENGTEEETQDVSKDSEEEQSGFPIQDSEGGGQYDGDITIPELDKLPKESQLEHRIPEYESQNVRKNDPNIDSGEVLRKHPIPGVVDKRQGPQNPSNFGHSKNQHEHDQGESGPVTPKFGSQVVHKRDQSIDLGKVQPKPQIPVNMGPITPAVKKYPNELRQSHSNPSNFGHSENHDVHDQGQPGLVTPQFGNQIIGKRDENIAVGAVPPKRQIPVDMEPEKSMVDEHHVQLRPEHYSPFILRRSHTLGDIQGHGSGEMRLQKLAIREPTVKHQYASLEKTFPTGSGQEFKNVYTREKKLGLGHHNQSNLRNSHNHLGHAHDMQGQTRSETPNTGTMKVPKRDGPVAPRPTYQIPVDTTPKTPIVNRTAIPMVKTLRTELLQRDLNPSNLESSHNHRRPTQGKTGFVTPDSGALKVPNRNGNIGPVDPQLKYQVPGNKERKTPIGTRLPVDVRPSNSEHSSSQLTGLPARLTLGHPLLHPTIGPTLVEPWKENVNLNVPHSTYHHGTSHVPQIDAIRLESAEIDESLSPKYHGIAYPVPGMELGSGHPNEEELEKQLLAGQVISEETEGPVNLQGDFSTPLNTEHIHHHHEHSQQEPEFDEAMLGSAEIDELLHPRHDSIEHEPRQEHHTLDEPVGSPVPPNGPKVPRPPNQQSGGQPGGVKSAQGDAKRDHRNNRNTNVVHPQRKNAVGIQQKPPKESERPINHQAQQNSPSRVKGFQNHQHSHARDGSAAILVENPTITDVSMSPEINAKGHHDSREVENYEVTDLPVYLRPEHHSPFSMEQLINNRERGQASGTSGKNAKPIFDPTIRDALNVLTRGKNSDSDEPASKSHAPIEPVILNRTTIRPEYRSPLNLAATRNQHMDERVQIGLESPTLGTSNIRTNGQHILPGQPKYQIPVDVKHRTPFATKPPVKLHPESHIPSNLEHSNNQQGHGKGHGPGEMRLEHPAMSEDTSEDGVWGTSAESDEQQPNHLIGADAGHIPEGLGSIEHDYPDNVTEEETQDIYVDPKEESDFPTQDPEGWEHHSGTILGPLVGKLPEQLQLGLHNPSNSRDSNNQHLHSPGQSGFATPKFQSPIVPKRDQGIDSVSPQPNYQVLGDKKTVIPKVKTLPTVLPSGNHDPSTLGNSRNQHVHGRGESGPVISKLRSQIVRKGDQNIESGKAQPNRQISANMGPETPISDKLTNESRQGHDNQSEFGKSNYQHRHGQEQPGSETPNVGSLNIPKHNIELGAVQPKGQIPVGLEPKAPKVDKLHVQLRPEHNSPFNQGQSHKLGDSQSVEQQPKHQIAMGTGPKIMEPLGGTMIPLGPLQIKQDNNQHGHGQGHGSGEKRPEKPAIGSNSPQEWDSSAESNRPHQIPAPPVPGHHIPPEAVRPHHQSGHGHGHGSGNIRLEHSPTSRRTSAVWSSTESVGQQPNHRIRPEHKLEGLEGIKQDRLENRRGEETPNHHKGLPDFPLHEGSGDEEEESEFPVLHPIYPDPSEEKENLGIHLESDPTHLALMKKIYEEGSEDDLDDDKGFISFGPISIAFVRRSEFSALKELLDSTLFPVDRIDNGVEFTDRRELSYKFFLLRGWADNKVCFTELLTKDGKVVKTSSQCTPYDKDKSSEVGLKVLMKMILRVVLAIKNVVAKLMTNKPIPGISMTN